jgi:hypothetical protein
MADRYRPLSAGGPVQFWSYQEQDNEENEVNAWNAAGDSPGYTLWHSKLSPCCHAEEQVEKDHHVNNGSDSLANLCRVQAHIDGSCSLMAKVALGPRAEIIAQAHRPTAFVR